MSLLNYGFAPISTTATTSSVTPEQAEGTNHDGLDDADSSDIDSVLPESDSETPASITAAISQMDLHHYRKFQTLRMIFLYLFHEILV